MNLGINSSDVWGQLWSVVGILGPLYAIFFGLLAVRMLLETAVTKIFPKPKATKAKRPRESVYYDRKQHPGLRTSKSKKGIKVSWYKDGK